MTEPTKNPASASAGECTAKPAPQPPVAKKILKETKIHGATLRDEYFWLRDKSNPEVAAYLEAENEYSCAIMAPAKPFQEALYRELLGHIKETDTSVPYRKGNYFYYSRTEEGKQYPIFCRKRGTLDAPEEITLDVNELAIGQPFMALGAYMVSDDGTLLAYSTDNTGFRQYTLQIKDLTTGALFSESIPRTGSVAWANDNRTLFYTVEDDAKRQYRFYRHVVALDPATASCQDELVYEEKDESFSVSVYKARGNRVLFLECGSHTTSEARYLDADSPAGEWRLIAPRIQDEEYYPECHGEFFYIRGNRGGRNFEVVAAPVSSPGRENWKMMVPHRDGVMIEALEPFANHMVLAQREDGLNTMSVYDLRAGDLSAAAVHTVKFPEPVYMASPGANAEWETSMFRYHYQSPVTPGSVYDYEMDKRESTLLKQVEVPGGFDKNNYRMERIHAAAPDGVRVPISVICRTNVARDGSAPLYLYGYGSYGYPLPLNFSSNRLALLDRGVVIALAHIRGGGDLGKPWHDAGRMMRKRNTFTDFIAVAEHLVADKYADGKRIVIEGGSAGGLLMGAVANMRPELWKAVVSKVPFVDVINTMLDASLPLTVSEYEEWGNPSEKPYFDFISSYSPYDNLEAKAYPAMLVKTSFHDSQVMYWEPAKYVAKLRTLKTDGNPLLLVTNMAAGHGGASGRYDYLREVAYDYAFILTQMGIEQ